MQPAVPPGPHFPAPCTFSVLCPAPYGLGSPHGWGSLDMAVGLWPPVPGVTRVPVPAGLHLLLERLHLLWPARRHPHRAGTAGPHPAGAPHRQEEAAAGQEGDGSDGAEGLRRCHGCRPSRVSPTHAYTCALQWLCGVLQCLPASQPDGSRSFWPPRCT